METPDMKYTGRIIKELREKAGENQEQLAAALLVANRETVARWESGARDLKREHIIALAKHFNVSADYLLGLSEVASVEADIQIAKKTTGLSEKAIKSLQYKAATDPLFMPVFSDLIEAETKVYGDGLFLRIIRYLITAPINGKIFVDNIGRFRTASIKAEKRKGETEIDLADFINSKMLDSVISCIREYERTDSFGQKFTNFYENFNNHREFEHIMCDETEPLRSISDLFEMGILSLDDNPQEEAESNGKHNPQTE